MATAVALTAVHRMVVCPFSALPITPEREHVTAFVLLSVASHPGSVKSEGGHSLANYDITFKRFCGDNSVTNF